MIKISKIQYTETDTTARISTTVSINNTEEILYIETELENGKYLVTDRCDAFVVGVLIAAMINKQDIKCEIPISSSLKFHLEKELIATLSKHDECFYPTKIFADITYESLESHGGVGTGISLGLDSFCTMAETYNSPHKDFNLTHLVTINNGVVGGFYRNNSKELCQKMLYDKIRTVSNALKLPLVTINTNVNVFLRNYYSVWAHFFSQYYLATPIMGMAKLFKYYYLSSTGDFSEFNVVKRSYQDSSTYDLLSIYCFSQHNGVTFLSGGGEKTRVDKLKTIVKFPIATKNLQSCLTEHFNCMHCDKCKRNLVCLDAIEMLEEFSEVYNVEYYKEHRMEYLEWMCYQISLAGYQAEYIMDAYEIIKKREPDLIESLTFYPSRISQKYLEMKRQRNVYKDYETMFLKLLQTPDYEMKLKEWFEIKNIHKVIVYGYGETTKLLLSIRNRINISVEAIIYNRKDTTPTKIPVLPEDTTDYPECDAVIISQIDKSEMLRKKCEFIVDVPIYTISEVLNL